MTINFRLMSFSYLLVSNKLLLLDMSVEALLESEVTI